MNTPTLRTALLLLASATISSAQVDDILANTGTFKPRISVSDRYSEKVSTTVEDGEVYRELEANPESIAITVVANIDGAAVGVIDAETSVSVTAWHFDHAATLGEASDYKPGTKRVTFPLTKEVELANGDTRLVRVGSVTYAWTAKTFTATVICTDIVGADVNDIAASDYTNTADAGTSLAISNDPIDIAIGFGDATGTRTAFLKGFTRTTVRKCGSEARGDYEEFELCDVTLQGAADITGPVVKSAFPVKPSPLNTIDVSGTAADIQDVSFDMVTVNGLPAQNTVLMIEDEDENGIWGWSATGVQLRKGTNKVVLTFSDADGNLTNVTKIYYAR